ncbi:glycosyltransferase family 2 protein [Streptomyces lunaelactis]|nr:glycosyltransferase family 2 protein [Streptomyces lunaelactis]NUK38943.1 glycosyltransferase family 2 protein [Streptomyces lunaelactis]NUK45421.1 glycosyltransferase family 2 protein [Streptomyces lunaelactis]NUK96741.1 glycosyltransferase family 2 protein [Streptomyces lunaelactis]NUL14111.1 glycosyltransferase family 2 protein [Streptomyces lunaelactis]
MGNRPAELRALLDSVAKQREPAARVVVVGHGSPLPELPDGMVGVELAENLGLPTGRNIAMATLREAGDVDVLVDLDDDGLLIEADVFTRLADLYEADPRLGIVSFRIADETGFTQRRHVPRLRAGDPMQRGYVTTFLGGGHGLSMRMLDEIGGWPDAFFFTHEETDLAWRALDADWKILYEPELVLQHPRTSPARHAVYYRMTARNRVWMARRHLSALLVPVYLGTWILLTIARTRSPAGLRAWFGGFAEGVRTPCGERRPMRWRTVWRMTRLGRPPVV